ncbi:MAG: T9SS type A sorting domain-containing protein [Candidatus Eisenbacteria bacterium]|nr:T9SS type A sorting domain-containing protein [Candidatus Eisenbacteria bacterium]
MEDEFGPQFVHVDTHVSTSDPFKTTETQNRATRYGVSGIPHVVLDGLIDEIGADVCPNQANTYRNHLNNRLAVNGGISKVSITGGMEIVGNLVTVTANFKLEDPASYTAHQGTLFLYEDDITWCCGFGSEDHWDFATRMVRSTPVSLTTVGQVVTVQQTWDLTTAVGVPCNPANLYPVAIFETVAGTQEVIQATDFVTVQTSLPERIASVPNGNGVANFTVYVKNLGLNADVFDLNVSGFPWTTDFQVQGDPNYYTSKSEAINGGEEKAVTIRVQTDNVKQVADGLFSVTGQSNGQVRTVQPRLFNGAHAILFVDADNNVFDVPITDALNTAGYLYDTVTSNPAGASAIAGYDAIVWHTGYLSATFGDSEAAYLQDYMDDGGRFFLCAMDYLTGKTNPNPFINDYLGVASWTNNSKALAANGVGGDPISDGMAMTLTFPTSAANRADGLTPISGASVVFNNENTVPHTVRYERPNHARSVFCTVVATAFPNGGADPNNHDTFVENTMTWLLENNTVGVEDGVAASGLSRIVSASPNPLTSTTALRFALSNDASRSPVSLVVVDASGREVRNLARQSFEAGTHELVWDGLDNQNRETPAGLYFAVLRTAEGETSQKLIRVR